jgi:hypothetical protein
MERQGWVTRDQFRELVNAKVEIRAGVSLDDLPDVNLDDWLDDDDGVSATDAAEAVNNAVAEILAENGWEGEAWTMDVGMLHVTDLGKRVAQFVHDNNFEIHRGVLPWDGADTEKTSCVVLFGNDAYSGDDNVDRQARTRAYVHGLYAGWSNLLAEGGVEFGTDSEGYSWAIVLHLPKGSGQRKAVLVFLRELVWDLFHANVVWNNDTE